MLRVLIRGSQPLTPEMRFGSGAACELSFSATTRYRAKREIDRVLGPSLCKMGDEVVIKMVDSGHGASCLEHANTKLSGKVSR